MGFGHSLPEGEKTDPVLTTLVSINGYRKTGSQKLEEKQNTEENGGKLPEVSRLGSKSISVQKNFLVVERFI